MNHQQLQRLLGGYASNTLTENERKALFEAALEDQDLFNALQQEQALKALLEDPVSRQAIRSALDEPQQANWWSRHWIWGTAGAMAVAAGIIAIVLSRAPATKPVEIAVNQDSAQVLPQQKAESAPEPARAQPNPPKALKKAQPETPTPPPVSKDVNAPPPSASQPRGGAAEAPPPPKNEIGAFRVRGSVGGAAPQLARPMAAPTATTDAAESNTLRFSLLKRDSGGVLSELPAGTPLAAGDVVSLNVFTLTSGFLSLEQLDDSGNWNRVGAGIPATANMSYAIPAAGIEVQDKTQRFRIVLTPSGGTPATMELSIGAANRQ